jgi:hypothetical protein
VALKRQRHLSDAVVKEVALETNPEGTNMRTFPPSQQEARKTLNIESSGNVAKSVYLGKAATNQECLHYVVKSWLNSKKCLLPFDSESFKVSSQTNNHKQN